MTNFFDTNSLLDLQQDAFKSKFLISNITLSELEQIKTSGTKDEDTKWAARKVLHLLVENEDKYEIIFPHNFDDFIAEFNLPKSDDSRIICSAYYYWKEHNDIIFITSDLACKALAGVVGLPTDFALIEDKDDYTGYKEVYMNDNDLANFYEQIIIHKENIYGLKINEYLLITDSTNKVIDEYKWTKDGYVKIPFCKTESKMFGKVTPFNNDVYQKIALDSLSKNQITMLRGPAGSGKAQPNSTLIPTKNGYIKLGDIKIGDMILDRYGNETKVLAVYPQGLKENYKITFSDGRIAYCNNEHLWSCYTSRGNLKNFTTQEMINSGLRQKCGDWKYKIPMSAPVEYTEKQFNIDPYVIGVFLGDGCCKEEPLTLSSNDEEIVSEVAKLINAVEYYKESKFNYNWTFYFKERTGIKGIKARLQTNEFFKDYLLNLVQPAQEKSIPEEYKFGSIQQRYSLIQGLMDTDGTIDSAQKGRTRFTSTSLKLIKDLQEICWSLGMSASISEDNREEKYTNGICYNLTISCEKENKPNLFRLKRKKDIAIAYANNQIKSIYSNKLTIKAIEKMPHLEEMTCILVDNEEHLYLTEQYIVTHNTYLAFSHMFNMLDKGEVDKIIIFCNTVATKGSAKLGFYPGSRTEKLLDSQIGNLLESKLGDRMIVEELVDKGKLILLPMSDIRGYDTSGMNAVIYISEAQNLDIELMRLALQRIGEDSKCIIDGDYETQLDMSIYAGTHNGMRRVSQVFRGHDFYGEIRLKNIYRSEIASLAQLM